MDKEIHWLLHSLNHFLHHCDEAEKAFLDIQDMKEEIQMWSKRYCAQELFDDTESLRESFMNFERHPLNTPEEVVEYLRKRKASDG